MQIDILFKNSKKQISYYYVDKIYWTNNNLLNQYSFVRPTPSRYF